MHGHDHDDDADVSLRPKSSRLAEGPPAHVMRAAAEGRSDVLDGAGVLGLQRAAGNAGVSSLLEEERSPVHDVVGSGGGRPLDSGVRAEMEARLGHDFGDVRVHDDSRAHDSAKAVNAHAYTVGSNVVFQRDKYDPSSTEGKTMLAHELTHVVQQRSGPVEGSPAGGGIKVSDPSDRFEREAAANAEAVMSRPLAAAPAATAGPGVQRAEAPEEEEEPVQTSVQTSVQRAEAAPEDGEEEDASVQGAFVQRAEAAPEEREEEDPSVQGAFVQRDEEPAEDEEQ